MTILLDGLFPINLSKFQVEKDHTFLDQPDIDSLIRRLNTLNRCADIMDSIPNSKVCQAFFLHKISKYKFHGL